MKKPSERIYELARLDEEYDTAQEAHALVMGIMAYLDEQHEQSNKQTNE